MHTPVFLEEVIDSLKIAPESKIIDCTAGEGGHLKKIAEKGANVLALDYDAEQIVRLTAELQGRNITLVHANFKDIAKVAKAHGFEAVDGILMDLGLSFRQLAVRGIGLSFQKPAEPLDMRLSGKGVSAAEILNTWSQEEIKEMIIKNAEEPNAAMLATRIVANRTKHPYQRVQDLLNTLKEVGDTSAGAKARLFQALRIEVNGEKLNLEKALQNAIALLKENGRLVVITFHSLEDRVVKQFGKKAESSSGEKSLKEIKVRIPKNARASFERSAQLRVYEKKNS